MAVGVHSLPPASRPQFLPVAHCVAACSDYLHGQRASEMLPSKTLITPDALLGQPGNSRMFRQEWSAYWWRQMRSGEIRLTETFLLTCLKIFFFWFKSFTNSGYVDLKTKNIWHLSRNFQSIMAQKCSCSCGDWPVGGGVWRQTTQQLTEILYTL